MWVNGLPKCLLPILFVMCPSKFFKISTTAFPEKSEEYVNPVINKPMLNPYLTVPTKWTVDVIKPAKGSDVNILEDDEPGFDLDDKEMAKFKIWKNGIIPFYIDDYSFDKVLRDMIRGFLDAVNDVTGLRFVELSRPPEDNASRWVFFLNRRGLLNVEDHPIREFGNTGVQKVVLGYNSMHTRGELPKAVLALVGVPPQHNAPDRDQFVKIVPENIEPDKLSLFDKLRDDEWLFHDVPYDFTSASHYHFHQYSTNGFATLKPEHCNKPIPPAGEGNGFSHSDVLKIRMLYNYISKKISDKERISDCSKLFKPGPNMTAPSNPKLVKAPRIKPYKYLGLPEKSKSHTVEEDDEAKNIDTMRNEYPVTDKNYENIGIHHKEPSSMKDSRQEILRPSDKNKYQRPKTKLKKPLNFMVPDKAEAVFEDMSDYKTD